ncbi:hypothetical protein A2U01_0074146, partial [Trifolium medium]|nr:hypothetical protein [Trifolium medium]
MRTCTLQFGSTSPHRSEAFVKRFGNIRKVVLPPVAKIFSYKGAWRDIRKHESSNIHPTLFIRFEPAP